MVSMGEGGGTAGLFTLFRILVTSRKGGGERPEYGL